MTRILSFVSPLLLMVMLNIAHADVVVVVSKDNPVSELTQQQVERIFLGKLMQFPGTFVRCKTPRLYMNFAQEALRLHSQNPIHLQSDPTL